MVWLYMVAVNDFHVGFAKFLVDDDLVDRRQLPLRPATDGMPGEGVYFINYCHGFNF